MFTLNVYHEEHGVFMMQLLKDGKHNHWTAAQSRCLEHAEAEACRIYPIATVVNGMKITKDIIIEENDIVEIPKPKKGRSNGEGFSGVV